MDMSLKWQLEWRPIILAPLVVHLPKTDRTRMENSTTTKAADPRKSSFTMNRLQKTLRGDVGRAIADYNMIQDGDLIMVCLSGGKDSYVMLDILLNLQKHAPINFRIKAVNM